MALTHATPSAINKALKQFRAKKITKATRKQALKLTKRTLKTFVALDQDIHTLREAWTVIKDNVQPDDDDPEGEGKTDPSAHEWPQQPDGILALAGLEDANWDADDVWSMLYSREPDVPGAIAEVNRLRKIIDTRLQPAKAKAKAPAAPKQLTEERQQQQQQALNTEGFDDEVTMCDDVMDLAVWIADKVEGFVGEPDDVFKGDLRIRIRKLLESFIARVDAEWPAADPAPIAALAQAALTALDNWEDDELVSRLTDRLSQLAKEQMPFPEPESPPESPVHYE